MTARVLSFPIESVTCFFCLGEFNRRKDEPDRRICPGCREEIHQFHEAVGDSTQILRASAVAAEVAPDEFDRAMEHS